jgi:hypothetical protein
MGHIKFVSHFSRRRDCGCDSKWILGRDYGGRPEMKVRKRTKAHSHGTAKFPLQLSQSLESSPHQPHSRSCSTGSMLAANRSSQGMDSRSDQ